MRKRKQKKTVRWDKTKLKVRFQKMGCAFLVTWVVLLTCFGLATVEYQAVVNCYISEDTMLSVNTEKPLETQIQFLGDVYLIDWSPLNAAAGAAQEYFALIPAPLRFIQQLTLYGEEQYELYQKEQRAREFMENI